MLDSWCWILGNELLGMLIAGNDVVPLVEQRIHCCRHHARKEASVGIDKDEFSVHDIDIAVVRVAVVVADVVVGMDDYYIDAADTAAAV